MRLVALGIIALILIVLLVRGFMGRPAWVLFTVMLVIGVGVGFTEMRWMQNEEKIQAGVAAAVGKDAPTPAAVCQRLTMQFAEAPTVTSEVTVDETTGKYNPAVLKWDTCFKVAGWMNGDKDNPTLEQAVALHNLGEQAARLTGARQGFAVECRAMQMMAPAAMAMGATQLQARKISEMYWDEVYKTLPTPEQSRDCVRGGALDESPYDAMWP